MTDPLAPADPRLERLERLARWLDTRFTVPGTNFRFGLDGLIGLIPGVGDTATGLISAYLIGEASRMGARKRTILRMAGNTLFDMVLGAVPVFGDLFDFAYKANKKNVDLLIREHRRLGAAEAKGNGPSPRGSGPFLKNPDAGQPPG